MALTAKQEAFCLAVATGTAQGEAYKIAYAVKGMSPKVVSNKASILMKRGDIGVRIEQLRAPMTERAIEKAAIDKAWVMQRLVKVSDMGMQAEPVVDNEGSPTGEYKQNLAAANKALELIGKELGMFVERSVALTGPIDGLAHDELKDMRDAIEQIRAGAAAGKAVSGSAGHTRH